MTTSLIVLALDEGIDSQIAAATADREGAARYVPVGGPPGEYPDADPGNVQAVWIITPIDDAVAKTVAGAGDRAEAYRVDSALQWDEPDGDPSLPRTPTRLAFINALESLDKHGFVEKWRNHAAVARAHQPDFRRYVQHVVDEPLTPVSQPYSGIGEFGMRRLAPGEGVRRFASPDGQQIVEADIRGFLDNTLGSRSLWVTPAPTKE
jgi:hypothetical protein